MGYDQLDRVIYTGKWETSLDEDALREYFNNVDNKNSPSVDELTPGTVTRTFYDRMPARDTLGVELYPPSAIVPAPTYTLGRVAAVVSDVRAVLDANGSAVQASDGSDSVIRVSTANSYDKYGRVLSSYAFDPTVPASADSSGCFGPTPSMTSVVRSSPLLGILMACTIPACHLLDNCQLCGVIPACSAA